jgi:hypothetical protein
MARLRRVQGNLNQMRIERYLIIMDLPEKPGGALLLCQAIR